MELVNCKYDVAEKYILAFFVGNNCKPIDSLTGEGWHYMVGPLKISGLISKVVRNHIEKYKKASSS